MLKQLRYQDEDTGECLNLHLESLRSASRMELTSTTKVSYRRGLCDLQRGQKKTVAICGNYYVEATSSNINYVSAQELHTVVNRWDALEALIVSHGIKSRHQGTWPAIRCLQRSVAHATSGTSVFAFRLCFESEQTANAVYKAYLQQAEELTHDIPHSYTIRLTPVTNCEWEPEREKLFRPAAGMERALFERKLHIFGFKPELVYEHVEAEIRRLGYMSVTIEVRSGRTSGTIMLKNKEDAERMYDAYGVHQRGRIYIGNIKLFVNKPGVRTGGMLHPTNVRTQRYRLRHQVAYGNGGNHDGSGRI
ncbi:hypothetical protein PF007_g24786 [Phytophthora fragariae]|uniref:Uncharacterized protein n=2 Tax=Phytophthora fragariae TaxID=53985 RepID=A0A6A3QI28_9STRA|nr:hypothetical protein PF009_g25562 [Phytophthora fragariae]KAE9076013.1 hypothetical protein PF007_g24786 [Phytophthora fragariae]